MKFTQEPFPLYKRCEKDGQKHRCATYPKCPCDWYDRRMKDGRRKWTHLPETAYNKDAAYTLALKKRLDGTLIEEGIKKAPAKALPLLSVYIEETYLTADEVTKQATFETKVKPHLAAFVAHIGDRPLDQVTEAHVESYRQLLAKQPSQKKRDGGALSRNTVQRYYNCIAGLFSYAEEKIPGFVNPCAKLHEYKEDPAERVLWQPDQLWLIEELGALYRLPLKVGRLCGCRRTEALMLTKHDLSPKGFRFPGTRTGWIALQRKKKGGGKTKQRIPIALPIINELRAQLKTPFQLHVFGDPPPNPARWTVELGRELRRLGEEHEVDVRGLCMHATRHTATTLMQDEPGVSAKNAQGMGGWTSTRMVETYSRPSEAGMLIAAAALARTYKPVKPKARRKRA